MSRLAQSYLTWAGNSVVVKCPIVSGRRRTSNGPYQGGNHAEACDYGVTDQVQSYLRGRLRDSGQKCQHGAFGNVQSSNEGDDSGEGGLALVSKRICLEHLNQRHAHAIEVREAFRFLQIWPLGTETIR